MKLGPFDIIKDLSNGKKGLIDETNESQYVPFLINRGFSYFPDTVFQACLMSMNAHLDNKLQHDYYLSSLRKKNRFSKWHKKEESDVLDAVKRYYCYSTQKTKEAVKLLSKEQIEYIYKVMNPEDA